MSITPQRLPHLARITPFLLSGACGGREALLGRSFKRIERIGEREMRVSGQKGREKNGERLCESAISCKVCLQGNNKMRKAIFNHQLGVKLNQQAFLL